jgi:hypothetical protein
MAEINNNIQSIVHSDNSNRCLLTDVMKSELQAESLQFCVWPYSQAHGSRNGHKERRNLDSAFEATSFKPLQIHTITSTER